MSAAKAQAAYNPLALKNLKDELKSGDALLRVFLIYGNDVEEMEAALKAIKEWAGVTAAGASVTYSGFENSLTQVLDACAIKSMFSPKQFVVARHSEAFVGRKTPSKPFAASEDELKRLAEYLKNPPKHATLVFLHNVEETKSKSSKETGEPKKGSKNSFEQLKAGCAAHAFFTPSEKEIKTWLRGKIKKLGLSARDDAVDALVDAVGTDTATMSQALEKLALFKDGSGEITVADIDENVAETAMRAFYNLQDSLAAGDAKKSLKNLHNLLRQKKVEPTQILSNIRSKMRELARAGEIIERGGGRDELVASYRGREWLAEKVYSAAAQASPAAWRRTLALCYDAERKLKSTSLSDEILLDDLTIKICAVVNGGRV